MKRWIPVAWFGLAMTLAVQAQQAPVPPVRVRGTVQAFDGQTLTVATSEGVVKLAVGASTGINGLEARTIADIGDNAFIGTTAVKDAKGRWQATEVHIFPESMRGAGEGHYAWDLPQSTMTNAAVTGTAGKGRGRTLALKYAGGTVDVDVTRKTAIVALTAGDRSLLVPGATVFALAVAQGNGAPSAVAIIAETKGVKPPM
ncbi:MAG TPA: hypothetical protein VHH11_17630 [Gammaproteobacteria bacterium]|jgi:hypothetical protein|nr:hypothetical protein [Gammaproteobacteria bacterium]